MEADEERPLASSLDLPTWQVLHHLAEASSLSDDGKAAVGHALDLLERRLGRAWPRRQFAKRGYLFPELVSFSHVAVLPRLLTFAVQLESVAEDPTFAPVLGVLKREPSADAWQHAKLQLEVARAARFLGWAATFEPSIPGSSHKGDLLLSLGDSRQILVETTSVFRSRDDLSANEFEDGLQNQIRTIERRRGVHTAVELEQQVDGDELAEWLEAIEVAATRVEATGQTVEVKGAAGVVRVRPHPLADGTVTFSGVSRVRDAVPRLGTVVAGKVRQSRGPYPVWLRINANEGLFALTAWAHMAPTERITLLAQMMRQYTRGEPHLHGIVCSSGTALALGATDAAVEDVHVESGDGFFVRRLLGPHLARETVVVRLQAPGGEAAASWAGAYRSEPTWLDQDLAELGMPSIAGYCSTTTPRGPVKTEPSRSRSVGSASWRFGGSLTTAGGPPPSQEPSGPRGLQPLRNGFRSSFWGSLTTGASSSGRRSGFSSSSVRSAMSSWAMTASRASPW
jgi:hypothetical protein